MTQQRGRKSTAQLSVVSPLTPGRNGEPTFLGLFQDQRNAEDYAAKIENARVERSRSAIRRGPSTRRR